MGKTRRARSAGTSDVMLCQLSPTEWRVLDGRFEPTELRALLGFIHASGDDFEVVRMDAPNAGIIFASLAEAKAEFVWHPMAASYLSAESAADESGAAGHRVGNARHAATGTQGRRVPIKA